MLSGDAIAAEADTVDDARQAQLKRTLHQSSGMRD